jgi:hypothetical protein
MEADERALLAATLREVLSGPADKVAAQLDDLGWDEVVADDPATATTLLFTEHGRALATTTLLDDVLLAGLDLPEPATAVLLPALAGGDQPSPVEGPVAGLLLGVPEPGGLVAVPLAGNRVVVIPVERLEVVPLPTFDPSLRWSTGTAPALAGAHEVPSWPLALSHAHLALAAELNGVTGEVIRLAVEHTSTRHQFGAPIAGFQAVRHRLAEAHVALTAATALLDAAWVDGTPQAARAAKAQAGRAHQQASAHALQVCGAMGSSLEHPLHTFVSRGTVLDALLGGWQQHVRGFGRRLLETGEAPRLIEV